MVCFRVRVMVKRMRLQTSPPSTSHGWGNASPLEFLSGWQKQFSQTSHQGSHGKVFPWKVCLKGSLWEDQTQGWQRCGKSRWTSVSSISIGMSLTIPLHSKMSPEGLLKSLLVRISVMLSKRFFAKNSNMMLVLTVGLCRASMFVPLNEQCMVMEGERIRIVSEECFTSISHSFDGSALGKLPHEDCARSVSR